MARIKLILIWLGIIFLVVFVAMNMHSVTIEFIGTRAEAPAGLVILGAAGLGALITTLVGALNRSRRKSQGSANRSKANQNHANQKHAKLPSDSQKPTQSSDA